MIYLIRHGETEWALSGKHTGATDIPLTREGERRAAALAGSLAAIGFRSVRTSPLQRARRTCELAGLGAEAQVEPDAHEWDYGAYEGRTTSEIRAERPNWNIFTDGCPGGESPEAIGARADRLLQKLRALPQPAVLFSHGHFLRVLGARWLRQPVRNGEHFALTTASVSCLDWDKNDPEVPTIILWNARAPN